MFVLQNLHALSLHKPLNCRSTWLLSCFSSQFEVEITLIQFDFQTSKPSLKETTLESNYDLLIICLDAPKLAWNVSQSFIKAIPLDAAERLRS